MDEIKTDQKLLTEDQWRLRLLQKEEHDAHASIIELVKNGFDRQDKNMQKILESLQETTDALKEAITIRGQEVALMRKDVDNLELRLVKVEATQEELKEKVIRYGVYVTLFAGAVATIVGLFLQSIGAG